MRVSNTTLSARHTLTQDMTDNENMSNPLELQNRSQLFQQIISWHPEEILEPCGPMSETESNLPQSQVNVDKTWQNKNQPTILEELIIDTTYWWWFFCFGGDEIYINLWLIIAHTKVLLTASIGKPSSWAPLGSAASPVGIPPGGSCQLCHSRPPYGGDWGDHLRRAIVPCHQSYNVKLYNNMERM